MLARQRTSSVREHGERHRSVSVCSPSTTALVLSFIAVALALVTGWLGGELVDRLGVGVDRGAHLDAPSSLSGRPAAESAPSREIHRAA